MLTIFNIQQDLIYQRKKARKTSNLYVKKSKKSGFKMIDTSANSDPIPDASNTYARGPGTITLEEVMPTPLNPSQNVQKKSRVT